VWVDGEWAPVPGWSERRGLRRAAPALAIAALTVVAYTPALRAGFVFDDGIVLFRNPLVLAADGLARIWFSTEPKDYFPLTYTSLWLEWRLWGDAPFGYHAVNLALHAASAILLGRLLATLRVPGAWWAALLFAVHPAHVSSVAWISERKNTLSGLLALVALVAHVRFDTDGRRRFWAVSLGAFLLALCSKTSVVMWPCILLGVAWWRRGRVTRRDLVRVAPFFALALVMGLITVWFQHHRAIDAAAPVEPWATRLAAAGWALWFYTGSVWAPWHRMLIYPRWQVDPGSVGAWLPLVMAVAVVVIGFRARHGRARPVVAAIGFQWVMLAPVLGVVGMAWMAFARVADHFDYIPSIGPCALAGALLAVGARAQVRARARVAIAAGLALVVGATAATAAQAATFTDDETLWRATLARNPAAWVAHYNLGVRLLERGQRDEAGSELRAAIRLRPDHVEAHDNLGSLLADHGDLAGALAEFTTARRLEPGSVNARRNLALTLARMGRAAEAVVELQELARLLPDNADVHYNLGAALANLGRTDAALPHLEVAIRLRPDDAQAHASLGMVLEAVGRRAEARTRYQAALALRPGWPAMQEALARRSEAAGAPSPWCPRERRPRHEGRACRPGGLGAVA